MPSAAGGVRGRGRRRARRSARAPAARPPRPRAARATARAATVSGSSPASRTPSASDAAQPCTISGGVSRWNCRPQARSPSRNAWCGYFGLLASRTAPGGSEVIASQCHCTTTGLSGRSQNSASSRGGVAHGDEPGAELGALLAALDRAAGSLGQQLPAEADAEHRHAGPRRRRAAAPWSARATARSRRRRPAAGRP